MVTNYGYSDMLVIGFGFIAVFIDAILAKPNLFRKYATMPLKAHKKFVLSFFDTAKPIISK